jgi:hypothetical protein
VLLVSERESPFLDGQCAISCSPTVPPPPAPPWLVPRETTLSRQVPRRCALQPNTLGTTIPTTTTTATSTTTRFPQHVARLRYAQLHRHPAGALELTPMDRRHLGCLALDDARTGDAPLVGSQRRAHRIRGRSARTRGSQTRRG